MRTVLTQFFCLFSAIGLTSCAGKPPLTEYVLSNVALDSAKEAEASKLAKKLFYKSQALYNEALRFYEERQYNKAKELFNESRYWAEKAQLKARVIKHKKGEAFL